MTSPDIEVVEDCPFFQEYGDHDWSEPVRSEVVDGHEFWKRECRVCGEVEEELLYEEHWEDRFIEILGKKYRAKKFWGNICTCSECGEVIMDVPLILFEKGVDDTVAVTFHFECAEKLGILDLIRNAPG